jgi:hypothetical protein
MWLFGFNSWVSAGLALQLFRHTQDTLFLLLHLMYVRLREKLVSIPICDHLMGVWFRLGVSPLALPLLAPERLSTKS